MDPIQQELERQSKQEKEKQERIRKLRNRRKHNLRQGLKKAKSKRERTHVKRCFYRG